MDVMNFAEIEAEFKERTHKAVWCNMATVDRQGRPRSRVVHPVWEGQIGWATSTRDSFKAKHLVFNPYISLAYVADVAKPVYVDCHAVWMDDLDEKKRLWEFIKAQPEPLGFDPGTIWESPENPKFGMLKLTPWRIQLDQFPEKSLVWRVE